MLFQFEIPDDKLKKVLKSGLGKIRLSIRLSTVEQTQKNIAAEKFFNSLKDALPRYSAEEQKIISAWNKHPYIIELTKSRNNEGRNNPVYDKDCTKDFDAELKKVVKKIGVNNVIKQINSYLKTCSKNGHIWGGINHGFKSLFGFLHKLYTLSLKNEKPWWDRNVEMIKDDDPEMTERIFKAYGRFFMDTDYDIEKESQEYETFIKLRKRIINRLNKGVKPTRNNIMIVVNMLFEACNEAYPTVFPGTLVSKYTWQVVLPQYVKKIQ